MLSQLIGSHVLRIFFMCQIWPLNLLQGQTGVNHLKSAKTRLLLVLEVWDVKSTYRKPCPANIFDVSNLTFNPSFKVRLGSTILKVRKTHLFLEVWDVKSTFRKPCPANLLVRSNLAPPSRSNWGQEYLKDMHIISSLIWTAFVTILH